MQRSVSFTHFSHTIYVYIIGVKAPNKDDSLSKAPKDVTEVQSIDTDEIDEGLLAYKISFYMVYVCTRLILANFEAWQYNQEGYFIVIVAIFCFLLYS